jgi:hypothetical protein
MFLYILTILLSILIIFGAHSGIQYIRDTYTVKKTKDVIKYQNDKYDKILSELATKPRALPETIPVEQIIDMELDLDEFVKTI